MSTPQAKRRRLDAAHSTLTKPFRSPFQTPLKTAQTAIEQQETPSGVETTKKATPRPLRRLTASTPASRPIPYKPAHGKVVYTANLNADPEIAVLLKEQRELERELREVKELLDVVEQAGKIERESEKKALVSGGEGGEGVEVEVEVDGELKGLVKKWKLATRGAAEELFGGVRDRVNRMGGPRAWKEMQSKQREFQASWDAEETKKPEEEDLDSDSCDDEEEKEEKKRKREVRDLYGDVVNDMDEETVLEKEERGGNVVDEDEGAEDEFTMAMMLKTLNIDPKTIGYDKEAQRWVD